MDRAEFVTIVTTFERTGVVERALASIIAETVRADARLIVHDCSRPGEAALKRGMIESLRSSIAGAVGRVTVVYSDQVPLAHARNMSMRLALDLHAPDFVAMIEDDHGVRPGFIGASAGAMRAHYGRRAPNGLRYGFFGACAEHAWDQAGTHAVEGGHTCPTLANPTGVVGGVNNCCRMAPTSHWLTVLGAYDTDEYPISEHQTSRMNYRNYHKGFTRLIVGGGSLMFALPDAGRGTSAGAALYDRDFAASDLRSVRYAPDGVRAGGAGADGPSVGAMAGGAA